VTTDTSPHVVRIVYQSGVDHDCAIATLAMLCGATYAQALAAYRQPLRIVKHGAHWFQMREAAKRLGVKTRVTRRFDIDEDTGILCVRKPKEEHVVFLWEGRIIDGNGEAWLMPVEYLDTYGYRPTSLLVRV
jgi:ABC-type bacteriocin/lantibiotic exporter with double-glycine peptidase domain